MKKFITTTVALGALFISSSAFAQDRRMPEVEERKESQKGPKDLWVHVDANIATMQFSDSDGRTTAVSDSLTASFFRAGVKYSYFGAEVEIGQGLGGIDESGISLDFDTQTSFFGMLRYPGDKHDFFIRAGYHSTNFELSNGAATVDLESDGFVAGIGGNYYFSKNFGIRADITGYNTRDILDAGFVGGSIGLSARF